MEQKMTVTFLGTGTSQGIPVIGSNHPVCLSKDPRDKRLRVSVLVSWGDNNYVIDCGPDFRQQMLRAEVKKIDGVLLTHEHSDHTAGLDDIRPFNFMFGKLPFYGYKRVFDALRTRFDYIFTEENRYPGAPEIEEIHIDKTSKFKLGEQEIVPIEAFHYDLPVLGYRFTDFTYLTDIKTIQKEEIIKIIGTKVLVVNALKIEPHYSHFNLEEALAFVELIKPERAYFTHIGVGMGFHEDVQKTLPKNVFLAYDTLTITI